MKYKLSQICNFITEKIDVEKLKNENLIVTYISTENMLPNKNGVVMPTSIPKNGKVLRAMSGNSVKMIGNGLRGIQFIPACMRLRGRPRFPAHEKRRPFRPPPVLNRHRL